MAEERYLLQKRLGHGQMSDVWLAQDLYTQDLVALKIMTAILEDDKRNLKAEERFIREIEIARSLLYPHILPIINYGYIYYDGDEVPYLVSPYMQEGSLADLMNKRPPWKLWTLRQIADAVKQAAESLWYLHTRTPMIVHQDVKPGNFLVKTVGSAERAVYLYLCDFGISRWQRSSFALASELLGTFAFMAPEQVERRVDRASDQYALAVMASLLLTGKFPIQAATNEQYAEAHLHDRPLLPSELRPERINSPAVDAVIGRALEKAPEDRFPTIIAFAQALEQSLLSLGERSSLKSAPLSPDSPVRSTDSPQAEIAPQQRPQPQPADLDLIFSLGELDTSSDGRVLDEPLPAQEKNNKQVSVKKIDSPVRPLVLQTAMQQNLPARPKMICWSPDGNCVGCALYGHAALLIYRDGTVQEVRTTNAHQVSCLCWSPNGKVLAVSSQGEIRFWDVSNRVELARVLRFPVRSIDALDWSSNDKLAVWVENQIIVYHLPHTMLQALQTLSMQTLSAGAMRPASVGVLRWSSTGRWLAAGANNGSVMCWDMERDGSAWNVAPPGQKVNSLVWSPRSPLLAIASRDNRVVGWDACTQERIFLWEKLAVMPRMMSIALDEQVIIASGEKFLLSGFFHEASPTSRLSGQLLVACSPYNYELATLDEHKETLLTFYRTEGY